MGPSASHEPDGCSVLVTETWRRPKGRSMTGFDGNGWLNPVPAAPRPGVHAVRFDMESLA